METKHVQDAIKGVLESQDLARIICTDPQGEGTFTPIITIGEHGEHAFKTIISYNAESIAVEMYDRLLLDEEALADFRRKIGKTEGSPIMMDGGKRWMRFCVTKEPEHFMVAALIPIGSGSGKDGVAEIFRAKLSSIITTVIMFDSGTFDEPKSRQEKT
ncbi:MAG: hypothetical protein V1696_01915 [Candidatus Jorgensenbacteria bacterium]